MATDKRFKQISTSNTLMQYLFLLYSLEIEMNKFLATLLAGAFALTLGASAFAADAAKPVEAAKATATKTAEPVKAEAAKVAEPAKTEAAAVAPAADAKAAPAKKHQRKHAKKAAAPATAPVEAAPAAK